MDPFDQRNRKEMRMRLGVNSPVSKRIKLLFCRDSLPTNFSVQLAFSLLFKISKMTDSNCTSEIIDVKFHP